MLTNNTILSWLRNLLLYTPLAFFVIPTGAVAEGLSLTPYMGYRVGGDFTDTSTGTELKLAESESYGLIIGMDRDAGSQMEFIYSVQPTKLTSTGTVPSDVLANVDVENFLFAGKKLLDNEAGTFVSGMVGATRFDPGLSSLNSETRFALGVGGGVDHRLTDSLALRLEGRGIATFFNSNSAIFCGSNGGCLIHTEGSLIWQFEVLAGLSFRF